MVFCGLLLKAVCIRHSKQCEMLFFPLQNSAIQITGRSLPLRAALSAVVGGLQERCAGADGSMELGFGADPDTG